MAIPEVKIIPTNAVLGLLCPGCGALLQGEREGATEVLPRTFPEHFHVRFTATCRCGRTYRVRIKAYTAEAWRAASAPAASGEALEARIQPAPLAVQRPAA